MDRYVALCLRAIFWPTCELCDKKAEVFVRDIVRRTYPDTSEVRQSPDGPIHAFCSEHERPSQFREENYLFTASTGENLLDFGRRE